MLDVNTCHIVANNLVHTSFKDKVLAMVRTCKAKEPAFNCEEDYCFLSSCPSN